MIMKQRALYLKSSFYNKKNVHRKYKYNYTLYMYKRNIQVPVAEILTYGRQFHRIFGLRLKLRSLFSYITFQH